MLALLAAVVFAQSHATLQVGADSKDSVTRAKRDSIAVRRDQVRDSLRTRARIRDSVRKEIRIGKRVPLTPAILASAFKDPRARAILLQAREARLTQDSSLTGYDANAYERLSVGMGFKHIGRDRLLLRSERASHVMWQRGKGATIDVKGARSAFPMLDGVGKGDIDLGSDADIPYAPGRETLWIGSGLAKADVSENEVIHPLASGAEAYYTYESGDSVGFQLPGGQRLELRELRIRPRQPKWNVAVGSLWFDAASGQLVRAVYRMAQEMDIMAVAKEANEEEHDPDDDIPRWVKPMITPMKANVSAITVEYGLHEGRFWLPRSQAIEGEAQVSFMHIPFKLEQRYTYESVNGTVPLADVSIAMADTATDSLSRAGRRERRREECKGGGTERVRREVRSDEGLRILIRIPCDTAALARSSELPKSIYDEGEAVFGTAERDALISEALTLGAQPNYAPQRPTVSWGVPFTRFNRVEGFSSALAVDQVLGGGYSTHALFRLGIADLSPNGELSLDRTDGRRKIGLGVYRRLVASNDWGDPLGFNSSLSALFFGRDDGFYYRTWGAELKGEKDYGLINNWRLFAEQHFDATVHTEFAIAHPGGVKGDLTNIDAENGKIVGLAVEHHSSFGLDPHGFRALTDFKVEGGTGTFDYSRGSLQTTLSRGLGGLDGALTLGAGTSGGHLPIQKQYFLGGVGTVRGQKAGAAIGDSFWMTSAEFGTRSTGFRKIVFGDLGWAGDRNNFSHPGRPLSGAGIGASFMDGLFRIDLSKGIYPEKSVRANLYVEARF
jgi:hypothetical protein